MEYIAECIALARAKSPRTKAANIRITWETDPRANEASPESCLASAMTGLQKSPSHRPRDTHLDITGEPTLGFAATS